MDPFSIGKPIVRACAVERVQADENFIVYRKRKSASLWASALFLVLVAGAVLATQMLLSEPRDMRHPLENALDYVSGGVFECLFLSSSVAMLFLAGHEDLILDLKAKTFRFRKGVFGLARWREGDFSEIESLLLVAVKPVKSLYDVGKSALNYRVYLIWRGERYRNGNPFSRDGEFLAVSLDRAIAQEHLERIAQATGIPVERETSARATRYQTKETRRIQVFLIAIGVLLAALQGGASYVKRTVDAEIAAKGRSVAGRIADMDDKSTPSLYIQYTANGATITQRVRVTQGARARSRIGDDIPVTYLPDYPRTMRIGL